MPSVRGWLITAPLRHYSYYNHLMSHVVNKLDGLIQHLFHFFDMLSVWQRLESLKVHFLDFPWSRSSRCNFRSINQPCSWEAWRQSRLKWGRGGSGGVIRSLGAGPAGARTSPRSCLMPEAGLRHCLLIPSCWTVALVGVSFESVMQWWSRNLSWRPSPDSSLILSSSFISISFSVLSLCVLL